MWGCPPFGARRPFYSSCFKDNVFNYESGSGVGAGGRIYECRYLQRPAEGARPPGTGVTGRSKLLVVGARVLGNASRSSGGS